MTTENTKLNSIFERIPQPSFNGHIAIIQSEFHRNNAQFSELEPRPGFWSSPWLPLRAIRGPHSNRISEALLKHDTLKRFAHGVDERSVYSATHFPCSAGFVDWETANDNEPLAFALYDVARDSYKLFCIELDEVAGDEREPTYRINVYALIDLHFDQNNPNFVEHFIGLDNPLKIIFRPDECAAETDIFRLSWDHFHSNSEFLGRLSFITEVLGDPSTQLDPT